MKPSSTRGIVWGSALFLLVVTVAGTVGGSAPQAVVGIHGDHVVPVMAHAPPKTLPGSVFVSSPPSGAKGPDDITYLSTPSLDWGRPLVWTAYQNGINPNGTPGTPGGPTNSTVVGYDPALGVLVKSISVPGKVDGLTADPAHDRLIATVNEDDNSGINVISPGSGTVTRYNYAPNPAVSGNGGTDSIAIWNGLIYTTHSNPNDTTQAAEYLVTLHPTTRVAQLTPIFSDNSWATARGPTMVRLALTDPDTNAVMPTVSPRFAGDLATVSQADGKVIFAHSFGAGVWLHELNLTDNVSGNLPPIDGFAVATSAHGTLYVVDGSSGTITALSTAGWPAGTVFVGEPSDNGNPLIGTLNLFSGKISPLGNHFVSPKGILFVPDHMTGSPGDHADHGHRGGHADAPLTRAIGGTALASMRLGAARVSA
jgi:hypothetical protein